MSDLTPLSIFLIILIIWDFLWKAAALWKAGRNNQVWWFAAIMVFATAGILPILYLRFFQRKPGGVTETIKGVVKSACSEWRRDFRKLLITGECREEFIRHSDDCSKCLSALNRGVNFFVRGLQEFAEDAGGGKSREG